MIPGSLGSNIEGVVKPEQRAALSGHRKALPSLVQGIGIYPEDIFAGGEAVQGKVGNDDMANIRYRAVAMYRYADKFGCGLQRFMAGTRRLSVDQIVRGDLVAANRGTAQLTGHSPECPHEPAQ